MKKRFAKLLAAFIALALLCGAAPLMACAAEWPWPPADAVTLVLDAANGTPASVPAGSNTQYFTYTSGKTAWYVFEVRHEPQKTIMLYDADGNQLAAGNQPDTGKLSDGYYRMRGYLTAGETYYCKVTLSYLPNPSIPTPVGVRLMSWPPAAYYSYTPDETAAYIFAGTPACYLADAQFHGVAARQLRSDNRGWISYYELVAGETYYFDVSPDAGGIQTAASYLVETLAQAKKIGRLWLPSGYWNTLQTAIAEAQAVVNHSNATQRQIIAALYALAEAVDDATRYHADVGQGFNYRPGYIIALLTKYSWGDSYMPIILLAYLSKVPLVPFHLLLVGWSWFIGLFSR